MPNNHYGTTSQVLLEHYIVPLFVIEGKKSEYEWIKHAIHRYLESFPINQIQIAISINFSLIWVQMKTHNTDYKHNQKPQDK